MDGHFGPDCRVCPSSFFLGGGGILHQYVTAVMTNNVTHTWMHKSKRYVDVLRDILRQTLNQFHSSLELIGPVFYDTLNK